MTDEEIRFACLKAATAEISRGASLGTVQYEASHLFKWVKNGDPDASSATVVTIGSGGGGGGGLNGGYAQKFNAGQQWAQNVHDAFQSGQQGR